MNYKGIVRGKTIELEEPLPYSEGQRVTVFIEPFEEMSRRGSAEAIREAMNKPPHLSWEDVDEFERIIEEGQIPASERGIFDEEQQYLSS